MLTYLACVGDYNGVHHFHQNGRKWVQFDMIAGKEGMCSISGDTIAISGNDSDLSWVMQLCYKYDLDLGGVIPIQDPIDTAGWVASMDLSNDYLVYCDWLEEDAFIYN